MYSKKESFFLSSFAVCVYLDIFEILLSIRSVCIHIFISVKEGKLFFQYKLNLVFWIDNTCMGLKSKDVNRYVMINLPLLFSILPVPLHWRYFMLFIVCVSREFYAYTNKYVNMFFFFFSFRIKEAFKFKSGGGAYLTARNFVSVLFLFPRVAQCQAHT